jgi:hypothetical protein
VDGETVRGSWKADGIMVHHVSAWMSGVGLMLGIRSVNGVTNSTRFQRCYGFSICAVRRRQDARSAARPKSRKRSGNSVGTIFSW